MDIKVTSRLPKTAENACQLVFLFTDGKLKGVARKIDSESDGLIKQLFESGDFSAKPGQTQLLHGVKGSPASRVALVGLGDRKKADAAIWRKATAAASGAVVSTQAVTAISDCLVSTEINALTPADMASQLATDLVNAAYTFQLHPHRKSPDSKTLTHVTLSSERKHLDAASEGARRGRAIGMGMSTTRDLGNLAPNYCTPSYLADKALAMADNANKLDVSIVDEEEMESLGMGAMLAVSRGSEQPAKLIVMNYQGRKRAGSPIVLVGKGITFDTGGISIKPSAGMDEMKYDMCGAASVFGIMQAIAELELELNVVGIVAAAENMPDGSATRPGDVVTSMSGQSIEILNTDAEGRLVLCDALTYSSRFKPSVVIDMATLTGACVVALGHVSSALMGNHQGTIDALLQASEDSGDRCWPMPLWDDYQSQLDSNFADMGNIGGKAAGAITAACFLARFAEDFHWAHLDIAGIAWKEGAEKGATGRPVPLLMQYVLNQLDNR